MPIELILLLASLLALSASAEAENEASVVRTIRPELQPTTNVGRRGRLVRIAVLDNEPKIKVGDPVEFQTCSGPRPPDALVMERQPDPTPITGEEETLIRKLGQNENIRTGLLTEKARFYTLTHPIESNKPFKLDEFKGGRIFNAADARPGQTGPLTITVTSDGLAPATLTLKPTYYPIPINP